MSTALQNVGVLSLGLSLVSVAGCAVSTASPETGKSSTVVRDLDSSPDGGPVAHGLQLHLVIDDESSTQAGDHTLELTLQNVSDQMITLSGDDVRFPDGSFVGAMPEYMWFSVYPEVEWSGGQWCEAPYYKVRPYVLKPGEHLQLRWQVPNNEVRSERISQIQFARFSLPSDGLYFVRAGLTMKLGDESGIRLWSNEVPYSVGGKRSCPKPPIAEISTNDSTGTVRQLRVGRRDGVAVGDTYDYRVCLGCGWRFRVFDVGLDTCRAEVTWFGQPLSGDPPTDPPKQGRVYLRRADRVRDATQPN